MSEVRVQKILCPKCKKELEIQVWNQVEIPYDAEQKERVLKNSFFRVDCEACKSAFPIAYNCTYNDMEEKYLLWMAPVLDEQTKREMESYNQKLKEDRILRMAQGGYRYRIVRNENELREKVIIFDEGLDDRYIETMKTVYVPLIKKEMGAETKIANIFFDRKMEGGYEFIFIFENKPNVKADVNMDIYYGMMNKLKDIVDHNTSEGLCRIDAGWGLNIMMHKVEE